MKVRAVLVCVLSVVLLLGLSGSVPAQSKRVIQVSLTSWKFEPEILKVNEGDVVVLQLSNNAERFPHNIASAYLNTVNFTVRGDGVEGTTAEGWKRVQLEAGKKAEVEFVAKGRGQVGFICSVFDHASRGMTGAFILWPPGYHPNP